jgi:hypothetical protein
LGLVAQSAYSFDLEINWSTKYSQSITRFPKEKVMKARKMLSCVLFALLVVLMLGGCAPGKYTPTANEEIYGTWTNPEASRQKFLMLPDGTWKLFISSSDTVPSESGTYQLVKKWKDSDGNTWYDENASWIANPMGNQQVLVKIDATGKTIESSSLSVGKFDNQTYPKAIDRKDDTYSLFHRAE